MRKLITFFLLVLPIFCHAQTHEEFREHLLEQEGYSRAPYKLRGQWHIGIGHKFNSRESIPKYISKTQVEIYFVNDLSWAYSNALVEVPSYYEHPEIVRIMIVSLIFNVGPAGFHKFYNFRLALQSHNYKVAASELSNSLWAIELPDRAEQYVTILNSLQ